MPTHSIKKELGLPPLKFAATSKGADEFVSIFRQGALVYLLPMVLVFIAGYIALVLYAGIEVSPYALMMISVCGLSLSLNKLNKQKLALQIFFIAGLTLLVFSNYPALNRPNGFVTGGVYLYCIIPVLWWLCFAERRGRLLIIATCLISLAVIASAGQPEYAKFRVPDVVFNLSILRCYFFLALILGICHGFDVAIYRYDHRWSKALKEQKILTVEVNNKARDLEREVNSHRSTLVHLSKSEGRYKSLIDHAFEGIYIFDSKLNRPIEINQKLIDRLGYTLRDLANLTCVDISPASQADGRSSVEVRDAVFAKAATGSVVSYEWRFHTKEGKIADFEITSFRLPAEPHIQVSVFHDLTERKLAQQYLTTANRELKSFAHAASHDLKEPLRTMSNFASLLERKYGSELDEAGREYIAYITDAGRRGTKLVGDLLKYAELGIEDVETTPIDFSQVAISVRQTVAARLEEEGAELTIEELPTVLATSTWAQQLLQNLISNALKFKRAGIPPVVKVYTRSTKLGHEICVQDNGIGIAPEDMDTVFGVFQRLVLRDEYEGNGIGLALCKRIMEKLGGDIRVESKVGEGSTFIISFPTLSFQAVHQKEVTTS